MAKGTFHDGISNNKNGRNAVLRSSTFKGILQVKTNLTNKKLNNEKPLLAY